VLARGLILERDELAELQKILPGQPEESAATETSVFLTVHFSE
jgi:hypothetical protein